MRPVQVVHTTACEFVSKTIATAMESASTTLKRQMGRYWYMPSLESSLPAPLYLPGLYHPLTFDHAAKEALLFARHGLASSAPFRRALDMVGGLGYLKLAPRICIPPNATRIYTLASSGRALRYAVWVGRKTGYSCSTGGGKLARYLGTSHSPTGKESISGRRREHD